MVSIPVPEMDSIPVPEKNSIPVTTPEAADTRRILATIIIFNPNNLPALIIPSITAGNLPLNSI